MLSFGAFFSCLAGGALLEALTKSSFAGAGLMLLFLAGGLFCMALGIYAFLYALPFQLELHREPVASCYTWRNWTLKRVTYDRPEAIVFAPAWSKGAWPFVLFIRTKDTRRVLLRSHRQWPTEVEARLAARDLANEVAQFAGCKVEDADWSDAAKTGAP